MAYSNNGSYLDRVNARARNVPNNYYFQEESIDWSFPKLLPGHIYTFSCLDAMDESEIPSVSDLLDPKKVKQYLYKKPYVDQRPIGIAMGRLGNNGEEYVLNLKAMPKQLTLTALQYLFKAIHQTIDKNALDKEREMLPIQERMKNFNYVQFFSTMDPSYFRTVLGRDFYFWVNKYNTSRIRNVSLIDFDVIDKISLSTYEFDTNLKTNGSTMKEIRDYYVTKVQGI